MESGLTRRRKLTRALAVGLAWISVFGFATVAYSDNMRIGPFHFDLGLNPGFRYTDNVNSSETNPKSDFQLTIGPSLSGGTSLEALGGEQLTISMAVSYEWSVTGNQANSFSAPVNFSLMIPVYLAQWNIVLAEAFSFENSALETTFAFNQNKVPQYGNTASISGTRNLGKFALTLAFADMENWYPDNPGQDFSQYQFSVTPSYFLREGYSVFWQNVVGYTVQVSPKQNSVGFTTALGLSGQITPSLSGSISFGWAWSVFQSRSLGPGDGIFGGIFDPNVLPSYTISGPSATMALNYTHPLRPNTTYTLSFFENPGVQALLQDSNVQSTLGVNFGLSHRLNSRLTVSPLFSWQHIEDVGQSPLQTGPQQRVDMLQFSIGLSRQITRKLSSTLQYLFQTRTSNLEGQSYQVNEVTGSLTYTF